VVSTSAESDALLRQVLPRLLRELFDGAAEVGFILNPGDPGLARSVSRLSAAEASARPGDRSSVAAHVHHLRYGLTLLNRFLSGDAAAFDGAAFAASWQEQPVGDDEWRARRDGLAAQVHALAAKLERPRDWDEHTLAIVVGCVAHLAYHLGAIRQLTAAAAGPRARD
jgi:hypothetical protein